MSGRGSDGLGECCYKVKTVLDGVKKLVIPGNLMYHTLALNNNNFLEIDKTHLL